MSLKIGQLKASDLKNYSSSKVEDIQIGTCSTSFVEGLNVEDSALLLKNSFLKKDINYYLTFKLTNQTGINFEFILTLYNKDSKKEMPVKRFFIKNGESKNFDAVFTPNDNIYNIINFKILRTQATLGLNKKPSISTSSLFLLKNILSSSNMPQIIKKIGIQANSGFTFCMNGEEIKVGRTKIYEAEDILINNLAFIETYDNENEIHPLDKKFFIMDYLY